MHLIPRFERLAARARAWLLRRRGIRLGREGRIGARAVVRLTWGNAGYGSIQLGDSCDLRDGVLIESWGGDIRVGRNVFIGPFAVIYGHGGIAIGDDTLISMHCCIVSSIHTIAPHGVDIRSQPDLLRPTKIGRDVWLGANSVVLGGITIGDGCIVGAGAVVTKSLPPGAIVAGVPAQIARWREGAAPRP